MYLYLKCTKRSKTLILYDCIHWVISSSMSEISCMNIICRNAFNTFPIGFGNVHC